MTESPKTEADARAREYDAWYFGHCCGHPYERTEEWLGFFDRIAERLVRELRPRSALDAGCAMGFLVEGLRKRGVDAFGVDVSDYAISHAHPAVAPYCTLGSITAPLSRDYDLVVCIEVLEHLDAAEADLAIRNFCAHAPVILFSSTPNDYKEATHRNVQPPEYWAEKFAQYGFYRDVDFDASFVTPWALCVRRSDQPAPRIVRGYERRLSALTQENRELRSLSLELRTELSRSLLQPAPAVALPQPEPLPEPTPLAPAPPPEPASPAPALPPEDTQSLRDAAELQRLRIENDYWKDLAGRYARGRLMRAMAWIHRLADASIRATHRPPSREEQPP